MGVKSKNILILFIISFAIGLLDAIALPFFVRFFAENVLVVRAIGGLERSLISLLAFYFLPKAFELEFSELFISFTRKEKYRKYRYILAALFLSIIFDILPFFLSLIDGFFLGTLAILLTALGVLVIIMVMMLLIKKIFVASVRSSIYIILLTIIAEFLPTLILLISIWIKYGEYFPYHRFFKLFGI